MRPKYMTSRIPAVKYLRVFLSAAVMVGLSVALAHAGGGEGGEEITAKDWMWRIIDFSFVAALLGWIYVKFGKVALKKRVESIEESLAEAKAAREEALKRLAQVEAKLKDKDREIQALVDVARDNGAKEKALLTEEGERLARDIVESARENIDAELLKAKEALRREAALMAVELAEKMVRENIKKEDQARILEEYMAKVGG